MALSILTLIVAMGAIGMPLLLRDLPAIMGTVRASGATELWPVKLLLPLLVLAGLAATYFLPAQFGQDLQAAVPSTDLQSVLAIGVGAATAVMVSSLIHRWTAIPYAFMGAIFGCQLMADGQMDWSLLGGVVLSWIAAPVLCALLAALLAGWLQHFANRRERHLAIVDRRMLVASVMGSILLLAAWAWNIGPMMRLFPGMVLGQGMAVVPATLACAVLLYACVARRSFYAANSMAETELEMNAGSLLAIILSMAVCFALFSWEGIRVLYLAPTPLSACALLVAALVGVSLVKRNAVVAGEDVVQSLAACAAAPVLGILLSYCLSMILGVNVSHSGSARLLPSLILMGIVLIAAALYLYLRAGKNARRHQRMLHAREDQVYATQKALSALEVRVETNEKDLLNKLDIKRQQLVDFAVGVSDQKAFMEKVYEELLEAKRLVDEERKDAALEDILSQLRERMYFTREMNDFYARTEVLHRDFNMRLKEAFPALTESERKLANLLRQGFSSKYIASLMNITPKSVEISRYRLRNKLGLKRSDNLVQYIKSI